MQGWTKQSLQALSSSNQGSPPAPLVAMGLPKGSTKVVLDTGMKTGLHTGGLVLKGKVKEEHNKKVKEEIKEKKIEKLQEKQKVVVKEEHSVEDMKGVKEEEGEVRGNPTGRGRTEAGKATKAASTKTWKKNKRAMKKEGVVAQEIERMGIFIEDQSTLPLPFQEVALLMCMASLRVTLYRDFITTKAKGNGWKTQWGNAHALFLSTFKQELARHETEVIRCEVKLGALYKAWKEREGPQFNPQGQEQDGGSAARAEWDRVAPLEVQECKKAIELLEKNIVEELEMLASSSNESLNLG